MKLTISLIASSAIVALSGAAVTTSASAEPVRFKNHLDPAFETDRRSRLGRTYRAPRVAGFRRRGDYRRVPSHYQYRGYPYWAARAFQPHGGSR